MMRAYYNDNNAYCVQWLRNLVAKGLIADGDVDDRDIRDVRPEDLRGYRQVHFFAGLGGWAYALRLAEWPDDREVWTGSCPCQPLSVAGQRQGHADERHLWPAFHGLISKLRPAVVFGEQVAGKDGREWLAGIRLDLEGSEYACGAADLCAAGVGAPHIRSRLYWMAHTDSSAGGQGRALSRGRHPGGDAHEGRGLGGRCGVGSLADADGGDAGAEGLQRSGQQRQFAEDGGTRFWDDCEWLPCSDGKARPVEPGTFPLAHGVSGRMGKLRAYGNAIVPQVAAEFIRASLDAISGIGT